MQSECMSEKLYTAREYAKLLGIHEVTVYRLRREGKIPCIKVGRSVRFMPPKEAIHEHRRNDGK